ncbi:YihY/virulence factor BrkB family protein [Pseudonocardia sp.]|jgi:membrane protein|uniref:YihY/virulence factor BrkB family protein n=1 Tax=Pseudonocardia sp. TaxID=60912 RepID=UPI00262B535D|nr:YihY/virulence factor BrkB family protein [Pseudonocardia sp.]MCW2720874.1 ribonuclease [Pseudonocardia sp.]MDT7616018.1 rane protein [Pseudonocardiales bacterium]
MAVTTGRLPGDEARRPTEIPPRGWWQIVRRAMRESSDDNVSMLAGSVAYFVFLALFPGLIAAVTLYGLVADPAQIERQVGSLTSMLPREIQPLIVSQLTSIVSGSHGALGVGLVVSLLVALWSASSGTSSLIEAVNLAYDEKETRNFVRRRGLALLLTLGGLVFVLLALALVAVVPLVLNILHLGLVAAVVAQVLRWVLLVVLVILALAVVYRVAPDRDAPKFRWVSPGSIVATVLWIVGSAAFSFYVDYFSNYNKFYGALAGVVVLLLWLYLTCYIVLLGAEINAEAERQTRRDSTEGEEQPLGERGATAADEVARD